MAAAFAVCKAATRAPLGPCMVNSHCPYGNAVEILTGPFRRTSPTQPSPPCCRRNNPDLHGSLRNVRSVDRTVTEASQRPRLSMELEETGVLGLTGISAPSSATNILGLELQQSSSQITI